MTGTWRDKTSITLLLRFTAGSKDLLIAAHLVIARKMGGKVGLICGSCWSGKYSTYIKSTNRDNSILIHFPDNLMEQSYKNFANFLWIISNLFDSVNGNREIEIYLRYLCHMHYVCRIPFTNENVVLRIKYWRRRINSYYALYRSTTRNSQTNSVQVYLEQDNWIGIVLIVAIS